MNPRRPFVLVAALATVLLTAAGCAREPSVNARPHLGTGTASEVAGVQQITLRSGLDLRFTPSTIVVHPGTVRLILVNTAKAGAGPPHNITFAGLPTANIPDTDAGLQSSVTFVAPAPGKYSFVCTIHARQGQTGTLIVR
jgi:plastocyanin